MSQTTCLLFLNYDISTKHSLNARAGPASERINIVGFRDHMSNDDENDEMILKLVLS